MSNHKRGGTSHVNHDKVLTTTQADFVNKELNAGNGTMPIKKIMIQNKSVNTELDNAYQKVLITGTENKTENNNNKKIPTQMKEWSILSNHVKYVTSDGSEVFYNLSIDQVNYRQEIDLYKRVARRGINKCRCKLWQEP